MREMSEIMLIDLQLHSTYSDGYLTPSEAAKFVAGQGVKVAALTDHNTISGIDEFRNACYKYKIKPVTGLELYVKLHNWRFNLLWYNFDETDPDLHNMLRNSQVRRRRMVRLALKRLVSKGFKIDFDKILDKYNHYVPINRVVDDFLRVSYNAKRARRELDLKRPAEGDIIREYFYSKEIGILHNSFIDMDRIVELKKKIGGRLVLCHPAKSSCLARDFLLIVKKLGVTGLEKLSPHHSYNSTMFLQRLAREYGLIETGGSDFHCFEGGQAPLQYSWQYYKVDSKLLRGVKKIIG